MVESKPIVDENSKRPVYDIPYGGINLGLLGNLGFVNVVVRVGVNFFANQGFLAGIITGGSIVVIKFPMNGVAKLISNSLPQNHFKYKRFILVDGKKIYLDRCDQNLQYLIKVLQDENIPFQEKEQVAKSVLKTHLNLKTTKGRTNFVLCMVILLSFFSISNPSAFYIMIKNLIASIKAGKISKAIGRLIVRRLKKKGIPIDPDLIDVVSS